MPDTTLYSLRWYTGYITQKWNCIKYFRTPLCERCNQDEGTLTHLFWTCPKLHAYWALIFSITYLKPSIVIAPDPLVALFGTVDGNNQEGKAVSLCTLLAKRLILQFWKLETVPTFEMCLRDLGNVIHREKIRYNTSNRRPVFYKISQPILDKWSSPAS